MTEKVLFLHNLLKKFVFFTMNPHKKKICKATKFLCVIITGQIEQQTTYSLFIVKYAI